MKVLLLIVSSLLAVNALKHKEVVPKFEEFKKQYGKTYSTALEARARLAIFKANLKEIEAHNKLYEEGKVSYYKGINQFTDLTQKEFETKFLKPLPKPTIKGVDHFTAKNVTVGIPANKNWRDEGVVTHVKNQGPCGSCWAFSAAGSLEGQWKIQHGNLIAVSEQWFTDCTYEKPADGCMGGNMQQAFFSAASKRKGVPAEDDYPYQNVCGECRDIGGEVKVTGFITVGSSDEDLTAAIGDVGPISVYLNANLLGSYAGGIIDGDCDPNQINHGVTAVGYGTENGVDYYLFKNSWGEGWGDSGYFKMVRGKNQCGVTLTPCYPLV